MTRCNLACGGLQQKEITKVCYQCKHSLPQNSMLMVHHSDNAGYRSVQQMMQIYVARAADGDMLIY